MNCRSWQSWRCHRPPWPDWSAPPDPREKPSCRTSCRRSQRKQSTWWPDSNYEFTELLIKKISRLKLTSLIEMRAQPKIFFLNKQTFLVFSVFPAPDSPVMRIDWFLHSENKERQNRLTNWDRSFVIFQISCNVFIEWIFVRTSWLIRSLCLT